MMTRYLPHDCKSVGANEVVDAVASAQSGDRIVYFAGASVATGSGGQIECASAAWRMAEKGKVRLFRRPVGGEKAGTRQRHFEYMMVVR